MSEDLIDWLRRMIDEDERIAQAAIADNATGHWRIAMAEGYLHEAITDQTGLRLATGASMVHPHIARHDPARVLREVDSLRKILDLAAAYRAGLDEHRPEPDSWHYTGQGYVWHKVLRLLAAGFDDRPGYREEWRS